MRIFVDTNVLADVLVKRQNPSFTVTASLFLSLRDYGGYELCVSTVSLSTCFYLLRDRQGSADRMRTLTARLTVLDTTAGDYENALSSGGDDLEDALQSSVAHRNGCSMIVTRDRKGFLTSPVPFTTPADFLETIGVSVK